MRDIVVSAPSTGISKQQIIDLGNQFMHKLKISDKFRLVNQKSKKDWKNKKAGADTRIQRINYLKSQIAANRENNQYFEQVAQKYSIQLQMVQKSTVPR